MFVRDCDWGRRSPDRDWGRRSPLRESRGATLCPGALFAACEVALLGDAWEMRAVCCISTSA